MRIIGFFLFSCYGLVVLLLFVIMALVAIDTNRDYRVISAMKQSGRKEVFTTVKRLSAPTENSPDRICVWLTSLNDPQSDAEKRPVRICTDRPPTVNLEVGDTIPAWRSPEFPKKLFFHKSHVTWLKSRTDQLVFIGFVLPGLFCIYNIFLFIEAFYVIKFGKAFWADFVEYDTTQDTGRALVWRHPKWGWKKSTYEMTSSRIEKTIGMSMCEFEKRKRELLIYRAPISGRYWWEGDLPNFKPPRTLRIHKSAKKSNSKKEKI